MFEEVFLFSPLETSRTFKAGMEIIPTMPEQLRKRLVDFKVDVVRAYGGYWACDMACNRKVKGVPVVVSIHDTNPNNLYDSIKKADVVWCVSQAVKKLALTKYKNAERVWILPNRVDFTVMRPMDRPDIDHLHIKFPFKYRLLHVGRKSFEKNLDTLIKALNVLGDEYCVVATGRGKQDEYKKLAESIGVADRCFFIESIDNETLPLYYTMADCMCVPSRWEGFGIVFIEALACRAIVVTSDISPMNEYITHKENGFLVKDYEDPESLAEMIRVACNDRELREKIKMNARESAEKFEKKKIEKLEAHFYEKVIGSSIETGSFRDKIWNFLKQS